MDAQVLQRSVLVPREQASPHSGFDGRQK
jgi:hypothetical protein